MKAKTTTTPKKASGTDQHGGAAGSTKTPTKTKAAKPHSEKQRIPNAAKDSRTNEKQPVDYSEALDLYVPSLEEVEAEILEGIAHQEQGPGIEFSEVGPCTHRMQAWVLHGAARCIVVAARTEYVVWLRRRWC